MPKECEPRRVKYLTDVIERDHRLIKEEVRASRCFRRSRTAGRTPEGVEAVNMIREGRVESLAGSDARGRAKFVAPLSGIAA